MRPISAVPLVKASIVLSALLIVTLNKTFGYACGTDAMPAQQSIRLRPGSNIGRPFRPGGFATLQHGILRARTRASFLQLSPVASRPRVSAPSLASGGRRLALVARARVWQFGG